MKRKRRIMRLKRVKRRYVTRRRRRPKSEVKCLTIIASRQSAKMTIPGGTWGASAGQDQSASALMINDLLGNITQGTNESNRIGRQIFVKSIRVKHTVELCSPSSSYSFNSGLLRITWCSALGTPGTSSVSDWYKYAIKDRILGQFNNNLYKLHRSKVYNITAGLPNIGSGTSTYQGMIKTIAYTLPLNRTVTYSGAIVKDEKDYYTMYMNAAVPNGTDGLQCFCVNTQISIYFTDD